MKVYELRKVLAGNMELAYKDRFTHKDIDVNNMNRREKNMFRNREVYLMYPKEGKMFVSVF